MKKAITPLIFAFLISLIVSAAPARRVLAQSSGSSGDQKADAAPVEMKTDVVPPPAPAVPTEQPAPTPAAAATPDTAKPDSQQKSFMAQFSHKDFSTMPLKECADCHKGSGVAPTHGSDLIREHGSIARRNGRNCTDCHTQQFCLDCHKGGGIAADLRTDNYRRDYVPNTHRTDFREIHPLKVLDNPQTCYRCHDARFCSDCHAKFRGEDLMVQSHRRAWSDLQAGTGGPAHSTFTTAQCQTCHPNGLLPQHQWSADHAKEARRNLQA
ncbi:MAG TPA: hypothetical protein VK654_08300, partial [Nitrospirota bacterium]|nr:hypothetical protein [Nitrospirota bacterium]